MDLFKSAPLGAELTHQTNQRAVSWLATVCWSKNLNQECLWSSILLFYALKAQKKVKKENLELTRNILFIQFLHVYIFPLN
jgi:hypothetical protein